MKTLGSPQKPLVQLAMLGALTVACSSGTESPQGGTGGQMNTSTGGAAITGGSTGQTGGTSTGGTSTGGVSATGGAATTGGNGGSGSTTGGASGHGGMTGTGGAGGSGGQGGTSGDNAVAAALDGIRIDDPCTPNPSTTSMATCQHLTLQNGGFMGTKQVTMGGSPSTTYDVTLRIRGIAETAKVNGGTTADVSTFQYMSMPFRKVPFTVGGTVAVDDQDYEQWRINVSKPKEVYTLNDYGKLGHYTLKLDYQVTIPIAGGATVSLEGFDDNDHLIVDYEKYMIDGINPPMNWGQFAQVNVVSVKAR